MLGNDECHRRTGDPGSGARRRQHVVELDSAACGEAGRPLLAPGRPGHIDVAGSLDVGEVFGSPVPRPLPDPRHGTRSGRRRQAPAEWAATPSRRIRARVSPTRHRSRTIFPDSDRRRCVATVGGAQRPDRARPKRPTRRPLPVEEMRERLPGGSARSPEATARPPQGTSRGSRRWEARRERRGDLTARSRPNGLDSFDRHRALPRNRQRSSLQSSLCLAPPARTRCLSRSTAGPAPIGPMRLGVQRVTADGEAPARFAVTQDNFMPFNFLSVVVAILIVSTDTSSRRPCDERSPDQPSERPGRLARDHM